MSRRSTRLLTSDYYLNSDDENPARTVSYHESPVRVFKKRTRSRRSANPSARVSSSSSCMPPTFNTHSSSPRMTRSCSLMALPSTSKGPRKEFSPSICAANAPVLSSGYSSVEQNEPCNLRRMPVRTTHASFKYVSLTQYLKTVLLVLGFSLLAFGFWDWLMTLSDLDSAAHSVQNSKTTQDKTTAEMGLTREEFLHTLAERETKWMEDLNRDLESVQKNVVQLRQNRHPQGHISEKLMTELDDLKITIQNADLDHEFLLGEAISGVEKQISELRAAVSILNTEHNAVKERLHSDSYANDKLKAELVDWLQENVRSDSGFQDPVVLHSELQGAIEALEKRLLDHVSEERTKLKNGIWMSVGENLQRDRKSSVSVQEVQEIVHRALSLHRADGIGMADYALESIGSSVIQSRCSETHRAGPAIITLFGVPLWYHSESPRTIIQPEIYPGKCWAFPGSQGFATIALSYPVRVTHVSLEHIPKALSPTGLINSAPRDFAIYGMKHEQQEEGEFLGKFTYDSNGEPVQTFEILGSMRDVYGVVQLRVLSNWGHPEYTCVYRLRVHGQPMA